MSTSQAARELAERIRLAERHPVIGLAALSPGTTVLKAPGIARRLAQHVSSARPDLTEQVRRRLQPLRRECPHCRSMVEKDADRCPGCGKFVPSLERTLKAEFEGVVTQPFNEAATRLPANAVAVGQPFVHVPSGFAGRLIYVLDQRAALRDPGGQVITVPISEIAALGGVAAQTPPSNESQGGFAGRPATHTPSDLPPDGSYVPMGMRTGSAKAVPHGAMSKRTCTNCGAALSDEDIRDGECPECGADLTPDSGAQWGGTGMGGWANTPAAKAAYFSSPEGQLQLAKSIRYHRSQPGAVFGRATTSATLRKGGSTLVRGQAVRNRRTGQRGVVLQSNSLACAVEYSDGETTTTALEKSAELERL
jgi:RNA polymerase subunit RPABC4/transcription elongation factor Spt4